MCVWNRRPDKTAGLLRTFGQCTLLVVAAALLAAHLKTAIGNICGVWQCTGNPAKSVQRDVPACCMLRLPLHLCHPLVCACFSAPVTQCCKHFPPVFRHFFLEAFPDPSEWFEARTRYTRSTAVASMAGAVIGLGDRHLGNILLDMHSAEVSAQGVWFLLTAVAVAVRGHGPGCSAGLHTLPHGPVGSGMLPAHTWGSGRGYGQFVGIQVFGGLPYYSLHARACLPTCLATCLPTCMCVPACVLLTLRVAQVVHIDLGIAFEQGLFLQTAERVPFRLTPNIVDGMGAAGVEGTFRRCCETTMQVRGSCAQHPGQGSVLSGFEVM